MILDNKKSNALLNKKMKAIRDVFLSSCNFLFISYPEEMSVLFDGKDDIIPSVRKTISFVKTGILDKENERGRYIISIIFLLNSIESQYGNILWRSYFRGIHDNWWRGTYSKSSYYRMKMKAIHEFLTMLADCR